MDVTSATATSASTAAAVPQQAESVLSSDFETFLQMLTAQAKYQDPLEPIDSTEYAAQLAQFSMVEQQVKSNDLLTALSGQMGSANLAQLAGWIGMDARTTAAVGFDGTPLVLQTNPSANAATAELVVRDQHGAVVQRQTAPPTAQDIEWAGVDPNGTPLKNGLYTFSVESFSVDGKSLGELPVASYSEVREIRTENGATKIVLAGGSEITASEVTALRNR